MPKDQEFVVEHQRGISLFGHPFFSEKLLVPKYDPPKFVSKVGNAEDGFKCIPVRFSHGKIGGFNNANLQKLIPIPFASDRSDSGWDSRSVSESVLENKVENWYVMMDDGLSDVDDQGWMYSWSFVSRHWKYKRGFVRKRVWIRLPSMTTELVRLEELQNGSRDKGDRSVVPLTVLNTENTEDWCDASDEVNTLVRELRKCKLDRERLAILEKLFHNMSDKELQYLKEEAYRQDILNTFQFETSKARAHEKLKSAYL